MISYATPYKPEEVSYDPARIDAVNRHFEDLIAKKKILSANYCLARDGKVFANVALGKLSYREEDDRQLLPDTIQRIASIAKMFYAIAAWQLVEDGKLRVNQRVGEIIEEFNEPPFYDITIAHLLTHTSGLQADGGCYPNKYFQSPWSFIKEESGESWIACSLKAGMRKKPGEEWAYNSFGYNYIGEIISRVSGQFAHDYVRDRIIKPCKLKDTDYYYGDAEVAKRYNIPGEHMEKQIEKILSGEALTEKRSSYFEAIPIYPMYSTAYDLCRFGMMLQQGGYLEGERVLGRKAIEKMTTLYTAPHIKDYCWNAGGLYREYGLGPDMRCNDASLYSKGTYFHEGAGGCCMIVDPVEKLVATWFIPFVNDVWCPEPLYNAAAVMWSGLI